MLSVGGVGTRSRSKSPGRRDERSRSRDIRAPSPARRAPSPVVASKSKKYYGAEDNDSLVSDDGDDRRRGYSKAVEQAAPRNRQRSKYDDDDESEDEEEEEDERASSTRYADPKRYDYAKQNDVQSRTYRHGDDPRSKEQHIPGQFEDDIEPPRDERPQAYARPASYSMNGGTYAKLPQYQYQKVDPKEIKYTSKEKPQYTRTPSDAGSAYTRNPPPQTVIERQRHRRDPSYDGRDVKYDKYERTSDRKEAERIARARELAELEKREEQKKELTRLKKEREEREELELLRKEREELEQLKRERQELELRQRRPSKVVTIGGERDSTREDSKYDRRSSRYDNDRDDRREPRRKRHDDDDDDESDESDEEDRLEKLYHDRYKEKHNSQYDELYEDLREERRREKYEGKHERPVHNRRESENKRIEAQLVEIHPGGRGTLQAQPLAGPSSRTHRLSVSGLQAGTLSLTAPGSGHMRRGSVSMAPASPLLESYRGTYQSISPMPSPMALAHYPDDSDLSDLDINHKDLRHHALDTSDSDSDRSASRRKPKSILKRHREIGSPYDPEGDATALAAQLKRANPSPELLIKILPSLCDDSIIALRTEYKKHAKIQGKGINIAKHIKMKLGTTNVGKAAYACALGRWESEAHWANFWYQSGSSRRELLIEALFGRPNNEVKAIKEAFSDKRYGDSLVRCMEAELKKDKFRVAVMKALEAKRGDDEDRVSGKLVTKDAEDLHKALTSKEGGETALINVIVVRSDEHLRAIMQEYEGRHRQNFAREMIKKSQNLVGETLAHILNGVINRPVRDALLLRQAIAETSKDRAELIISRLVRFHWEPKHLERIKIEYRKRYGTKLEHDIEDGTKGDFSAFCLALCGGAVR